jgi:tetratricopeptide (TPR) repeat protein
MDSAEIFCRNVKTILAQRNIRIKDLAERIGLSESYLSLVLSGSRKNLNDEYKDRIASFLNITLSQLYSEELRIDMLESGPVFVEDPNRKETVRLVDMFLASTNLQSARPYFYSVLAGLNDHDARALRSFLSAVLTEMSREDSGNGESPPAVSMPEPERRLLAIYAAAGDGARLEWVRAAAELPEDTFNTLTSSLASGGFIQISEDADGCRSRLLGKVVPASSLFTLRRLRDIHLALAHAMLTYQDRGSFFEGAVAEHLLKAGKNRESSEQFRKSARLMESSGLWREAAEAWHRASIICGVLGDVIGRGNCLADAAKCLCAAGEFSEADECGGYACRLFEEQEDPHAVRNVCIIMGNMLREHDLDAAAGWYKKGIKSTPPEDPGHGILLVNLASALLEAARLDEAENTLKQALRWSAGRDTAEVGSINLLVSLNLGLIEYQRRNWKKAKTHFESCREQAQVPGAPLETAWHNLGMLMYRDDNVKMAREYLVKAQDVYRERGNTLSWAYAAIELAKVALRAGDLEEARKQVRAAEPYLEEKSLHEKGWVLLIRGCIDHGQRLVNQAVENGRKAVDIFQREAAERDLACAALWLSSLYTEVGDLQQATFLERRAFQIYDKRHWDVRELRRERSLLEPAKDTTRRDDA